MKRIWQKRLAHLALGSLVLSILFAHPFFAWAAPKMLSNFSEVLLKKEDVGSDVYLTQVLTLNDNRSYVGIFMSPENYEYYYGTSRDLVNWELKSEYFSLVYGSGIFVGLGYDGQANRLYYTKDGEVWKKAQLPDGLNPLAVKYENGYFKLTARDENWDNRLYVSTDAETWYDLTNEIPNGAELVNVISVGGNLYSFVNPVSGEGSLKVYFTSAVGEEETSWNEVTTLRADSQGIRQLFFDGKTVGVQLYSLAEYDANGGYVSDTLYYLTNDLINWEEKDWYEEEVFYYPYNLYRSTSTDSKHVTPDPSRFGGVEVASVWQEAAGNEWSVSYVSHVLHSEDGRNWRRDPIRIHVGGEVLNTPQGTVDTSASAVSVELPKPATVRQLPVDYVPDLVTAKSQAFDIQFLEPVEDEVPITFQLDPAALQGVDPKKVSIWQFVLPEEDGMAKAGKQGEVRIASLDYRGHWEPIGGKVDVATAKVTGYVSGSGIYAVMLSNRTFADIQNHPYRYEIEVLLAQGIINGYNDSEFRPDNGISRAEFAKVIVKAAHIRQVRGSSPFRDVGPTHWANVFVASAANAGLVKGYSSEVFGPNDPILREQAAAIAERAGGVKSASAAGRALSQVSDAGQISDYARDAVAGALEAGMVEPVNGSFQPKAPASRAVVAKLIMELMVNLGYL
jgi:hypothetical protein